MAGALCVTIAQEKSSKDLITLPLPYSFELNSYGKYTLEYFMVTLTLPHHARALVVERNIEDVLHRSSSNYCTLRTVSTVMARGKSDKTILRELTNH